MGLLFQQNWSAQILHSLAATAIPCCLISEPRPQIATKEFPKDHECLESQRTALWCYQWPVGPGTPASRPRSAKQCKHVETQHTVLLSRSERGTGMGHPSEMPANGTNSVIKLSFNMFYSCFTGKGMLWGRYLGFVEQGNNGGFIPAHSSRRVQVYTMVRSPVTCARLHKHQKRITNSNNSKNNPSSLSLQFLTFTSILQLTKHVIRNRVMWINFRY